MKATHIILIGIGLILIAVLAAFANAFAKNRKTNTPDLPVVPDPSGGKGTAPSEPAAPAALDYNKSIGVGSKGAEVKEFQRLYNATANTPKLTVDGSFGSMSQTAMMKVMGIMTLSTTLNLFTAKLATPATAETPAKEPCSLPYPFAWMC